MDDIARAAFDEATAMEHHWAGEEHILLALTVAGAGNEPPLLAGIGLTQEAIRGAADEG
jgi:hypothetical protein